jgi:hypothetical protein
MSSGVTSLFLGWADDRYRFTSSTKGKVADDCTYRSPVSVMQPSRGASGSRTPADEH